MTLTLTVTISLGAAAWLKCQPEVGGVAARAIENAYIEYALSRPDRGDESD